MIFVRFQKTKSFIIVNSVKNIIQAFWLKLKALEEMTNLGELYNLSNHNINVADVLTTELQKLHRQFPHRFPRPIHVQSAVYNNVSSEWKHRFQQAKHGPTGERIVFIPYQLENFFWTGVLMKFKTNDQAPEVTLIDPVINLTFLLNELQKQFATVYPDIIIQSKSVQTHIDQEHRVSPIVASLVRAIEEAQLFEVQSSFTKMNGHEQEANNPTSAAFQSNNSTNFRSVKRLNVSNVSELLEKIQLSEQRIKDYEELIEKEKKILTELKVLKQFQEEFGFYPSDVSLDDIKVTEEILGNLHNDFSSMPLCAERYLFSLIYYISLQLTNTNAVPCWTEIQNEFECLKARLKIEELETIDIRNFMETTFINIKRQNWKIVLVTLRTMLKHISPLKIGELFRLVDKVNETALLMKGQDIILFLGGTKVEKSKIIHFLAGSKMRETNMKGLNYIMPVDVKNLALKKSETSYMTLARINLKDMGGFSNESIILCDNSGFENVNRPEVDIANAIGSMNAIQGCKSVKPVVLVTYESIGNQLSSLRDLTHTLVRMIPGIKDYFRTFSYIFTEFPSNERNNVYTLLVNLKETISKTKKVDNDFMNFFADILQKTEKKVVVLNPIEDDPLEILEDLTQSAVINHPDEVFCFSMTEESKTMLQKQIKKHHSSIISATKRAEYDFVKYKLDQLIWFNNLIDQAYIRQTYNDCVSYISRHLLDEYQEGISFLNQTVLNDEDIRRYKICIEHAKLADEIRKNHLGKEVVHNSVFIQYLNQQIDILLVDLKDKDINDVLIKQTLDKIKLLSNSFYDIGANKYRDICEAFEVKLKSIVKSFESSVLSNEFDKNVEDMTRLSEALTILHDHLDHKDMEEKYEQMKDYFLNHLNNSIEKMNYMFVKEKLNQNDIDSLKSCVCMLEAVKTTFNLHLHISKEMIERIYEEFLSKIEIRFEEIVKKIHVEIRNRNSFHTLEQFMKELDSIRTISIIEQKTNQSYCSILEKLVEYLYELTRHIEELLIRQGKINDHKLKQSLSNLKEAQWINKYRASAYSNAIHRVEELVLQHIEEMSESVMKVNLNLDSYDKIELVQKILSDMNEMKCFEIIVPEVSQYLAVVHIYVNELIEHLCIVIKDTFSIEVWKEHGCSIVDLNKAENAFHYLNTCREIRIRWKTDYMSVYNSLKELIKQYSNYVQDKMKDCFEKIKQYPNINKEDLFERVRILSNCLQEISLVKNKYPQVFSYFSNQKIFEQWQEELSNDVIELEIQMEKLYITQQATHLNQKLLMSKALSKFDSSLEGEKYIIIYRKYQNVVLVQMKSIFEEVLNAIRQDDYETVAYEIVKLPLSDDVGQFFSAQFKRSLRVRLDDLMDETRMQTILLGDSLEFEKIKSIVKNLKRIQNAKRFVSQYFDTYDELYVCIEEVKKLIEQRINRFLESTKAVIVINDFSEVERRIDFITLVCAILENYCSKMVLDRIEALTKHHSNVVLKDVVEKYSEMDISEYFFHPPIYIFAKFEDVISVDSKYIEAFNKIKKIIFLKFKKELDQSRLEKSPDKKIIHLRRFESAVKYLPEIIRNALEIELKHCKDDITLLNQDMRFNPK